MCFLLSKLLKCRNTNLKLLLNRSFFFTKRLNDLNIKFLFIPLFQNLNNY
jgi:hypothetical protein